MKRIRQELPIKVAWFAISGLKFGKKIFIRTGTISILKLKLICRTIEDYFHTQKYKNINNKKFNKSL